MKSVNKNTKYKEHVFCVFKGILFNENDDKSGIVLIIPGPYSRSSINIG